MVSLASKEYVFPASVEEADFVQIIEQSLSDIGYVKSLKGHVHAVVINAYVRSIKYTHGNLALAPVRNAFSLLTRCSAFSCLFMLSSSSCAVSARVGTLNQGRSGHFSLRSKRKGYI